MLGTYLSAVHEPHSKLLTRSLVSLELGSHAAPAYCLSRSFDPGSYDIFLAISGIWNHGLGNYLLNPLPEGELRRGGGRRAVGGPSCGSFWMCTRHRFIYTCAYMYIQKYIYIYTYICVCMNIYVCIPIYEYPHLHIYIYTCKRIYIYICMYTYIQGFCRPGNCPPAMDLVGSTGQLRTEIQARESMVTSKCRAPLSTPLPQLELEVANSLRKPV